MHIAVTAARQHNIKPATLLARLRPETRKLIFIAEATFGRTRTRIHSLATSPWKLGVDEILSAFDETVLSSEDFLSNLFDFSTSGASWEDAHMAIVQASESRRSGIGRRPGISLDRVFVPQDVRDAAAATTPDGVVFRKKTRSQPKKTKGKKAAEREERQEPSDIIDEPNMFGADGFSDTDDQNSASKESSVAGDGLSNFGDDGDVSFDDDEAPFLPVTQRHIEEPPERALRSFDLSRGHSGVQSVPFSVQPTPTAHSAANPSHSKPPVPDAPTPQLSKDKLVDVTSTELRKTEGIPDEEAQVASALHQLSALNWMGNTAIFQVLKRFAPPNTAFFDLGDPLAAGSRTWDDWIENRHYHVRDATNVFIPLHLRQQKHWILLHIDLTEARVTTYNSMKALNPCIDIHEASRAIVTSLGLQWDTSWKTCDAVQVLQQVDGDFVNCGVFVLIHCMYIAAKRNIPSQTDAGLWRFLFSAAVQADDVPHSYLPLDSSTINSPLGSERHLAATNLCKSLSMKLALANEASQVLASVSSKTAEDTRKRDLEKVESDLTHWESVLDKASQNNTSCPDDDAALKQLLEGFISSAAARKKTLESELGKYRTHAEAIRPAVVAAGRTCDAARSRLEEVQQITAEAAQLMQTERTDLRAALRRLEAYMGAAGLL
ncbi:hypothetical protein SLS56_010539 [Neofusicoccum ribis]|uniref:Ubiquitin-like protease family profile domain-containing protein n=1 Tax=Neofusicoccum ribis TaxID=45134 RepID=A0ABR3SEI0_9PEZI